MILFEAKILSLNDAKWLQSEDDDAWCLFVFRSQMNR